MSYLNYLALLSLFIYSFTCAALPCFDVICFATNYKFSQSCKIGRKWIMMILFSSPLFLELMHTIRFDQKRVRPLFFLFSRSFLMFILKLQRFFFPYQYKISYSFFYFEVIQNSIKIPIYFYITQKQRFFKRKRPN